MISNWANLVARRDLLRELVSSELRSSTAQTRLGWLWWLLDPLLMMGIYWLIVVELFGRGHGRYEPYWQFIFIGLITWKHFSSSVSRATLVLSRRQGLIRGVPFPTMVLPIACVLSTFILFLCGYAVLLVMSVVVPPASRSGAMLPLIQVPALMLLQVVIITAIALPISCLGVMYRDLGEVIPHILRAGFYLSPGLYGVDLIRNVAQQRAGPVFGPVIFSTYMLNPFAIIITGYRDAVFYGVFMEPVYWLTLLVEAAVLCAVGYLTYQHYDRRVIKFL